MAQPLRTTTVHEDEYSRVTFNREDLYTLFVFGHIVGCFDSKDEALAERDGLVYEALTAATV